MIEEVRGMGLMLGVAFNKPIAKAVQKALFNEKYLVGAVGDSLLRLAPPLIINQTEADAFVKALEAALSAVTE